MSRVLAIDRGNDSVKGALFDGGSIVERWVGGGGVEETAAWAASSGAEGAAVSSVVAGWSELCEPLLRNAGIGRIVIASHDSPFPFDIDIRNPSTVGPDRLCAAAGVSAEGVTDAVIVDAGTAVTVDTLAGGVFLGGAIMPGPGLMLRALEEGTSALPPVGLEAQTAGAGDLPPGRDTESAMRAGVVGALRGGVAELVRLSVKGFGFRPEVFLTGGNAFLLPGAITPPPRVDPDLVLKGLNSLYYNKFE